MEASSPARLYCLLVGGVLVIAGIIGFFYEASFATGDSIKDEEVFGVLAVNGWHNLVHIAIGGLLLVAAGGAAGERRSSSGCSTSPSASSASSPPAVMGSASSPRTASCSTSSR